MSFHFLFKFYFGLGTKHITVPCSSFEFIRKCKNLDNEDFIKLKSFFNDFIMVFSTPSAENLMYKNCIFPALLHIWNNNYKEFNQEIIQKQFKKLLGQERINYWSAFQPTNDNVKFCIRDLLTILNKGLRTNKFK